MKIKNLPPSVRFLCITLLLALLIGCAPLVAPTSSASSISTLAPTSESTMVANIPPLPTTQPTSISTTVPDKTELMALDKDGNHVEPSQFVGCEMPDGKKVGEASPQSAKGPVPYVKCDNPLFPKASVFATIAERGASSRFGNGSQQDQNHNGVPEHLWFLIDGGVLLNGDIVQVVACAPDQTGYTVTSLPQYAESGNPDPGQVVVNARVLVIDTQGVYHWGFSSVFDGGPDEISAKDHSKFNPVCPTYNITPAATSTNIATSTTPIN